MWSCFIYIAGDNGSSAEGGIEGSINENLLEASSPVDYTYKPPFTFTGHDREGDVRSEVDLHLRSPKLPIETSAPT